MMMDRMITDIKLKTINFKKYFLQKITISNICCSFLFQNLNKFVKKTKSKLAFPLSIYYYCHHYIIRYGAYHEKHIS